jgi:sugar-specific transcriptional regulator TrmB
MALSNIKNDLLRLDFTLHDAEVYIALIDLGQTPAGQIITKTGLHRNIVYTSLEHLIRRKLVAENLVKKVKNFSAVNPAILAEEFSEKLEISKDVAQSILKNLLHSQEQKITVHQGNDEYIKLVSGIVKSMPKGSTKYVIGTGGEVFMKNTMRPLWRKYHNTALEQGIKVKMLSFEPERSMIQAEFKNLPGYEIKYLPNEIQNSMGIHIYPESGIVLNIIYSTDVSPVTAIKIQNKALAKSQLNFFANLWNMGKF